MVKIDMDMPDTCNVCKFQDVGGWDCLLNPESDNYSTFAEQYKHCPLIGVKNGEQEMSIFDNPEMKREELISHIIAICDLARIGARVIKHTNCNTCKNKDCRYRPECGDPVRWNCPLWEGGDGK